MGQPGYVARREKQGRAGVPQALSRSYQIWAALPISDVVILASVPDLTHHIGVGRARPVEFETPEDDAPDIAGGGLGG